MCCFHYICCYVVSRASSNCTVAAPAARPQVDSLRVCRRGARSRVARDRRRLSWRSRQAARAGVESSSAIPVEGEDGTNPSEPRHIFINTTFSNLGFTKYYVNMRSIICAEKRALLSADLENHKPDLVALTETWLDDSIEVLDIPGYNLVSRRDRVKARTSGLNYGGIALYSRRGSILVTHLEHSGVAEWSWHVVHTDIRCILLGFWYRPPGADARDISSFDCEL